MKTTYAWGLIDRKTKKITFDWLFKTKKEAIWNEGMCDEGRFEIKKVKITVIK